MEGLVTLNGKEQKRLMVLNKANSQEIRVKEAATILSLSIRQIWRLLAAYRKEGEIKIDIDVVRFLEEGQCSRSYRSG